MILETWSRVINHTDKPDLDKINIWAMGKASQIQLTSWISKFYSMKRKICLISHALHNMILENPQAITAPRTICGSSIYVAELIKERWKEIGRKFIGQI